MTRQYTKDQDSRIAKRAEELRKLCKRGFRLYEQLGEEFFLSPDSAKYALYRHKQSQVKLNNE